MTGSLRCFAEPRALLGEGPVWDPQLARLHWVDAEGRALFRLDPASDAIERIDLPRAPGSYAFRADGSMVMAYRNLLCFLGDDPETAQPIETPGVDFAVERFNDGACDRAGRFWVGTMDPRLTEPKGSLYRLDPDLALTRFETGLICSNGIAFSPDNRVMYHTDTGAQRIYAYDYDLASGGIANRRVFADFAEETGRPDGCTLDSEGCLWVAEIGARRVVRLDPAGKRIDAIALPMQRPTSVMLGGPDLGTLYITSMQRGLTDRQLAEQPQAGCLFAIEVDVPGLPEPRFAG